MKARRGGSEMIHFTMWSPSRMGHNCLMISHMGSNVEWWVTTSGFFPYIEPGSLGVFGWPVPWCDLLLWWNVLIS